MLNKLITTTTTIIQEVLEVQRLEPLVWSLHPHLNVQVLQLTEFNLSISQMRTLRPKEGWRSSPSSHWEQVWELLSDS